MDLPGLHPSALVLAFYLTYHSVSWASIGADVVVLPARLVKSSDLNPAKEGVAFNLGHIFDVLNCMTL